MSVKYGKFEMPQEISIDEETATNNYTRFIAEPLERGFGHTLGNSMRRLMLTALEAPAIISVRMEGVPHEYMAIDGIVEDMTNIILNLKGALLRKLPTEETANTREPRILTSVLNVTQDDLDSNNGQYEVTLKDIIEEGIFEVVNPDLYIFSATKPMQCQIDMRVAFGRGFVHSERHEIYDRTTDEILIDASFSP
ncbi:MAG: DNA-directed RNA polymerase subunit alpha, partial [Waddliaceae bacterium]